MGVIKEVRSESLEKHIGEDLDDSTIVAQGPIPRSIIIIIIIIIIYYDLRVSLENERQAYASREPEHEPWAMEKPHD